MYKPPFTITISMLNYSISISQKIEKFSSYQSLKRMPILRRNNRIKSIHSSLGIEANSLSLDQVRDVINGVTVLGPQNEINEVKDAFEAYSLIEEYDAFKEKDLLKAHGIIARSIDKECGTYRSHPEGVIDEQGNVVHVAPSEKMVPSLMGDLFNWLKKDKETPILIKSCVFHYEFVFIHPFGDGNGRMARLWQNVLLMRWNELFEHIPIESHIFKYQSDYYKSIENSNKAGNSNEFIEFMLKMIDETIDETIGSCGINSGMTYGVEFSGLSTGAISSFVTIGLTSFPSGTSPLLVWLLLLLPALPWSVLLLLFPSFEELLFPLFPLWFSPVPLLVLLFVWLFPVFVEVFVPVLVVPLFVEPLFSI